LFYFLTCLYLTINILHVHLTPCHIRARVKQRAARTAIYVRYDVLCAQATDAATNVLRAQFNLCPPRCATCTGDPTHTMMCYACRGPTHATTCNAHTPLYLVRIFYSLLFLISYFSLARPAPHLCQGRRDALHAQATRARHDVLRAQATDARTMCTSNICAPRRCYAHRRAACTTTRYAHLTHA
jgi:hypothetical protein